MFLKRLHQNDKERYLAEGHNHSAYPGLVQGLYSIVFHYDSAKTALIYEAYTSAKGFPPYLAFEIDATGAINSFPENAYRFSEAPLIAFLYEKEAGMTPKELEGIYKEYLQQIAPLMPLSEYQIAQRKRTRDDFLETIDFIAKEKESREGLTPLEASAHYDFALSFQSYASVYGESEREVFVHLILSSPEGEAFPIKDLYSLLSAYGNEGTLILKKGKSKISLKLVPSLFSEKAQSLLNFLSPLAGIQGRNPYGHDKDELSLTGEQFIRLCHLYAQELISYNGTSYRIKRIEKEAGLFLLNDGSISFYPPLENALGKGFASSEGLLRFDERNQEVDLYSFPNGSIGALYSFFLAHGEKSYDSVKDLLVGKLVPLMGASLVESAKPAPNEKQENLLAILYQIDITDEGALLFESHYQIAGQEKNREELGNNLYYASLLSGFDNALEELHLPSAGRLSEEDEVIRFLKADLSKLKKVASVLLSERLSKLQLTAFERPTLSLSFHLDYLSLRASCPNYSEEELAQILSLYRKKKKFVLLKDKAILLDDPALAELSDLAEEADLSPKNLASDRLPLYEGLKIIAKEGESLSLRYDDYLKKAFEEIKGFAHYSLALSPSLVKALRPYQLEAAQWMAVLAHYRLSGILADDMGMGKTLESIAFLSTITEKAPILIVSPKSVLYNWEAELSLWLPGKAKTVLSGDKASREGILASLGQTNDVYITSYDSLRNDLPLYEGKHFSLVILDEGQYIKNAMAEKSKAVKSIDASSRFALTGTPIENSYNDLWSIFDFLMPGYLGSYESFQKEYVKEDHSPRLKKLVAPFLLRRKKEDFLKDLPKKSVSVITLDMDEEERKLYDATLLEAKTLLEQGEKGVPIFALLTKLREICVDSSSFFEKMPPVSAKLGYVLDALKEAVEEGHKILLFSSFTKVLDHLRYLLDEEQIPSYSITGDTPASLRLKIADSFNHHDEVRILLVSLKAGGTGLNLYGADTVYHLDPWWNLASEEQATDRAYRIGQKRPVSVYKLVCHDSIEEKVLLLQEKKKALYQSVIQEGDEGIRKLSFEELMSLLS
jgi:SNF2 family DNA or RNA helicase